MIDHVFSDAIGALRDSLESARLERQSVEESFYTDLLTGSTTWRASYSLPGEGMPPRMHCDLALEWSTLSQTSYRQWCQEGELIDPMEILVVIVLRFQRLAEQPDPQLFVDNLPSEYPKLENSFFERSGPTMETIYETDDKDQVNDLEWAIEISYEGSYEINSKISEDTSGLDTHFSQLGVWVSSSLVTLGDLSFKFH